MGSKNKQTIQWTDLLEKSHVKRMGKLESWSEKHFQIAAQGDQDKMKEEIKTGRIDQEL